MSISDMIGASGELFRKAFFMQTRISMDSGGFMQIDSCRRIMECSDIYIKIRTVDRFVEIWGSGLELCCTSADSIIIEGRVSSIELTPAGKYKGGNG